MPLAVRRLLLDFTLSACLLPLALLALAGCAGKKAANVSGSVTLDGKPIQAGMVVFTGADNKETSGPILDGKYTVFNAPLGQAKVSLKNTTMPIPTGSGGDPNDVFKQSLTVSAVPPLAQIPLKYEDPNNGLTCEVKPGPQTFDVHLTP